MFLFSNKMLLAQDLTNEYLSTEHEIWDSHFFNFGVPVECFLRINAVQEANTALLDILDNSVIIPSFQNQTRTFFALFTSMDLWAKRLFVRF